MDDWFRPQSSFASIFLRRLQRYYGNWLSSAAISVSASVLIHAITDSASKYFCCARDLERQHQLRVSKHSHCDQQEIDPIFFYEPYYLEPQKGGDKAYVLLRETLAKTGKVGIAKVVIKTRQYLAGVKAKDSVLVLELMHFAEELADADKLDIPKKLEVGKRELDMAKALVDSMSSKWDPKKYRDDYREALMEVIEEKVEAGGKEIEEKPKPKPRPSTKVIDLVSVLQESLNTTKKSQHARKSSAATRHRKAA